MVKKRENQGFEEWLKSRKILRRIAGESLHIDRLLTGAFTLDIALEGGIPIGKVTEIFGDKAMGKTVIALNIVKNALQENMSVIYIDAENTLDTSNIIKNLKLENLEVVIPRYLEEMGEIALKAIKERDLIIIDSLTSLPPIDEYEAGLEKPQQALSARILGKFFRFLTIEMIKDEATVVILNQVRESMNTFQSYVIPGGKAQDFAASLQIYLRSGTYDEIKDTQEDNIRKPEEGKQYNMKKTTFDIAKSRVCSPRRFGDIYIVTRKFKDYKIGEIYNASIVRSYFRNQFLDLSWFKEYKTQEELVQAVRQYSRYKEFIEICIQKEKSNEI